MRIHTSFISLIFFKTVFSLFLIACTLKLYAQIDFGEKRVVFTKDKNVAINLINDTSFIRFSPLTNDIDRADSLLKEYSITSKSSPNSSPNIDNYFRQYVGFNQKFIRYIYVNASVNLPDYFLLNTLYPKGGGNDYFQALIDIDNRKVLIFNFNAPK
jgi:hypothetical protein